MASYLRNEDLWLKCLNPKPDSIFRLFCFPPAGSGTLFFRDWMLSDIFPQAEVYALCMPGRESRIEEPLLTTMESLTEPLLPCLTNFLEKPFFMFGHSLGAIVALELTLQLQSQNFPLPRKLFVSARQAPSNQSSKKMLHSLSDSELQKELKLYGGTPDSVMNNKDLMSLFLPIIRADLKINETYSLKNGIRTRLPISAFAGQTDQVISVADVHQWERLTEEEFRLHTYPGGHFPSAHEKSSILEIIASDAIS
ncbi:MAG: thioesterase [Leptolyngbya sp. SIOISBB]|nr:thioesterase [Leptolyngbya sp. SIOISBB]